MATPAPNVTPIRPNAKIRSGAEYVTGTSWFTTDPRALPPIEEDLKRDGITHAIIEKMLHDPDVFSALMLIVLMSLNEKVLITPAIEIDAPDEELDTVPAPPPATPAPALPVASPAAADTTAKPDSSRPITQPSKDDAAPTTAPPATPTLKAPAPPDPKAQLASDIADFCQRQVKRVEKFSTAMYQLVFEGLAYGNKVAELIFEEPTLGTDAGKWCLQSIKPKPRTALAWVVDAYMNELGFIGARPGQVNTVPYNTIVDPKEIIPREKFCAFTYRPKDNDPRGQTALDAALNGWDLKQRAWPEYLLFMMVCAIPGILATLPPNSDEITIYEDDGTTPKKDAATGEVVKQSAYQYLLNMLGKMRNHQVGVAPDGTTFTLLQAASEGDVFTKFFSTVGGEITHAILFQDLATRDSAHQTKGSTGTQFRVIDLIVFWVRDIAADMLKYDIFKPLVRYNFGDEAADELLPNCSYGDTEARDWATDATAAAAMADKVEDSQWDFITTQLGIPPPTDSERAHRKVRAAMLSQPQPFGGGAPGNGGMNNGKPASNKPDNAGAK